MILLKAQLEQKLAGVLLPRIEFRGTKVRDAISFLRQEAFERDDGQTNEWFLGVAIAVLVPDEDIWLEQHHVTLTLEGASLLEALHFLAQAASLRVLVGAAGVVLAPPWMCDAIAAAQPSPDRELPEWQTQIIAKYPALAQHGGMAHRVFVDAYWKGGCNPKAAMALADEIMPAFIHEALPIVHLPEAGPPAGVTLN